MPLIPVTVQKLEVATDSFAGVSLKSTTQTELPPSAVFFIPGTEVLMMPQMDGITLLKKLRSSGITTPALFLTAKTEVYQRIEGLDAGADDYLPKPFSTGELLARVRAMLRRKDNFIPDLLTFEDLSLNRSTYELVYQNKTQTLSGKEFQIMEMLMQNSTSIISAEQLITHIWGWNTNVDTSVIWVHISNIRKKIDLLGSSVSIKFVRNVGYTLEVTK